MFVLSGEWRDEMGRKRREGMRGGEKRRKGCC